MLAATVATRNSVLARLDVERIIAAMMYIQCTAVTEQIVSSSSLFEFIFGQ